MSNSSDTDFFIYYGNSGASETNSTDVWSNGYELVQHMNEDPSGSAPQLYDSTSNDNDGTSSGTMTTGDLVSGAIGNGIEFDGTDDYINIAHSSSLTPGTDDWSYSVWTNAANVNQQSVIISKRQNGSPYEQYSLAINDGSSSENPGKKFVAFHWETAGARQAHYTTNDEVDGSWHLITVSVDYGTR